MSLTDRINQARKAVAGFAVPIIAVLLDAVRDGSDAGGHISAAEWLTAVIAGLVGGGAVYGVSNARSADPDTSTPDIYPQDASGTLRAPDDGLPGHDSSL